MKVVLINPTDITFGKNARVRAQKDPPIGLAYIASALERAQHEVQIIDSVGSELSWNDTCETLSKSDPNIVGITLTREFYKVHSNSQENQRNSIREFLLS